ncbi:MAG: dUTP diphosphatase, partial [Candidatus Riesia sp.]|nr:dUTP diphosphatase [Candidatus Riesia sp.]
KIPDDIVIRARPHVTLIPTNICLQPPDGYNFEIHPRSSTLVKKGIVVNVGIIDSDYRGQIFISAYSEENDKQLASGESIAQLILRKTNKYELELVQRKDLTKTRRNEGGFGSTG